MNRWQEHFNIKNRTQIKRNKIKINQIKIKKSKFKYFVMLKFKSNCAICLTDFEEGEELRIL